MPFHRDVIGGSVSAELPRGAPVLAIGVSCLRNSVPHFALPAVKARRTVGAGLALLPPEACHLCFNNPASSL